MASRRRKSAPDQSPNYLRVHRLDEVVVEPGLPRSAPVLFLAPAGQRHDQRPRELGPLPQASGHLVAVHPRQADVQQDDVGAERRPPPRAPPARRGRPRTSWPHEPRQQHGQARRRRVRVVVHHQDAAGGAARGRSEPTAGSSDRPSRLVAAQGGRRTTNSLPRPGPSLWAVDRRRRASRPGCLTSVRPMPRPPCERSRRRSACVNRSKIRGSISAAMPMPVSRTRTHGLVALPLGRQPDAAARLGVLGGVVQQVAEHLRQPGRVGLQPDRPVGQRDGQLVPALLDQRAAGLDRLARRPRPGPPPPCGARSCPGVIRETSSRSSTSRTRCSTCRSIIARARSTVGVVGLGAAAGSAGALRIGASGLRSSWASIARNSSLRRSASRKASSCRLRSVMSSIEPTMRKGLPRSSWTTNPRSITYA